MVLQALGNCGSNCRTRECPTPSPPSLSLSLSFALFLSLFLHSAQPPTVLPTLSGKLGQLTSQLKVQSWVDFIGYFVMRMNGFMKLNLWAFFWGGGVNFVFCCTTISWTLLVHSSTSSNYLHKGGGQHWELWAGEKKRGRGLLFCHSISRNELSLCKWIVKVWRSCKR